MYHHNFFALDNIYKVLRIQSYLEHIKLAISTMTSLDYSSLFTCREANDASWNIL